MWQRRCDFGRSGSLGRTSDLSVMKVMQQSYNSLSVFTYNALPDIIDQVASLSSRSSSPSLTLKTLANST